MLRRYVGRRNWRFWVLYIRFYRSGYYSRSLYIISYIMMQRTHLSISLMKTFFHTVFCDSSTCRIPIFSMRKCTSWMEVSSVEFCRMWSTKASCNIRFGAQICFLMMKKLLWKATEIILKVHYYKKFTRL